MKYQLKPNRLITRSKKHHLPHVKRNLTAPAANQGTQRMHGKLRGQPNCSVQLHRERQLLFEPILATPPSSAVTAYLLKSSTGWSYKRCLKYQHKLDCKPPEVWEASLPSLPKITARAVNQCPALRCLQFRSVSRQTLPLQESMKQH